MARALRSTCPPPSPCDASISIMWCLPPRNVRPGWVTAVLQQASQRGGWPAAQHPDHASTGSGRQAVRRLPLNRDASKEDAVGDGVAINKGREPLAGLRE